LTRSFCINPQTPTISEEMVMSEVQLISSSDEGNRWYLSSAPLPGGTGSVLVPKKQGSYTVQVTIGGCNSGVSASHPFFITSIEDWYTTVEVYPNPVAQTLLIDLGTEMTDAKLSLTSASGVPLGTINVNAEGTAEVDMSRLSSGMYILHVEYKGKVNRYKVLRK
jgi:hypothetical protein